MLSFSSTSTSLNDCSCLSLQTTGTSSAVFRIIKILSVNFMVTVCDSETAAEENSEVLLCWRSSFICSLRIVKETQSASALSETKHC